MNFDFLSSKNIFLTFFNIFENIEVLEGNFFFVENIFFSEKS